MTRVLLLLGLGAVLGAAPLPPAGGDTRPAGAPVQVFTSTRRVTALWAEAEGTLWVGTAGGILRRSPQGQWTRFTRAEGLPSHEVRAFLPGEPGVRAVFPRSHAVWHAGQWRHEETRESKPINAALEGTLCTTRWQGRRCAATFAGLRMETGAGWRDVGMPPGTGTHLSALLPRPGELWAASFGDRLYAWNGAAWKPAGPSLPAPAREITALAKQDGTLWIGTARHGLWRSRGPRVEPVTMPGGPQDHNCQALAQFQGRLFVSTLEEGLVVKAGDRWSRVGSPLLSSNAPRQMAVFRNALYLRHGNGKVDRWTPEGWRREVFRLPRRQVSVLTTDGKRLYAGQWGGWSEFDGQAWKHSLKLPDLQGLPVTALLPRGDRMWVGTQGRGIAEVSRSRGTVRWHDERHGLTDDWITALHARGDSLYAGTFVGGLVRYHGDRWVSVPELAGENVTAIASAGGNSLLVTTRRGLWKVSTAGVLRLNDRIEFLDTELQALHPVAGGGVWVGARTGLFYLPRP